MRRPYKLISDFDGVWTDQALEAACVREFAIDALAGITGTARASIVTDYDAMVAALVAQPAEHGWAPDGRISAYVDEDPLCQCSALCRFLERSTDATPTRWREAVLAAGHSSLGGFGEHCFHGGTKAFRDAHPACIVAGARDMLEDLHGAGAEIVVVSNSAPEKLIAFFAAAGIAAYDHDVPASQAPGALRVRGAAGKWFIGETDRSITVGGRSIHVDRPRYRALITDERPDLVIGDVFSLDLALPHTMRTDGDPAAPQTLALRRHDHTPRWILDGHAGGAIDAVVDQVGDLAAVVASASRGA